MHITIQNQSRLLQRIFVMLTFISLSIVVIQPALAAPEDILRRWQVIDDKTGFKKATCEFAFDKKTQTYYCRLTEITPRPGYKPRDLCQNCPAPFTNKPIKGMVVLWNMKAKGNNKYVGGYGIDPLSGKVYQGSIELNLKSKSISIRATPLETKILSRTFVWIAE